MSTSELAKKKGNSAGIISAFVDSIDSQMILRMIRESKTGGISVQSKFASLYTSGRFCLFLVIMIVFKPGKVCFDRVIKMFGFSGK